jgi:GNAT superfamily N-acetyltransferase
MPSDPTRLDEFLVLEGAPAANFALIKECNNASPHWLTIFTSDPVRAKVAYRSFGYRVESDEFLMHLPDLSRRVRPPDPNIRVNRVQTAQECEWLNHATGQVLAHPAQLSDPTVGFYYVRQGELAVASGRSAVVDGRVVGPDKIRTHPHYRRQGLAFALVNEMHRDALVLGCSEAVLLSSVEGQGLYHKLGYNTVSPAVVFVSGAN